MQHEQSVADSFNSYMRNIAVGKKCKYHSFSLNGQDRDAGADYLLTDSNQFSLIEFKYQDSNLRSERHKEKRLSLCLNLEKNLKMKALHDKCHFICWSTPPSGSIRLNIYRKQICNIRVFGDKSGLTRNEPETSFTSSARSYSDSFFEPARPGSLGLAKFQLYLEWLLTVASKSNRSYLELITYNAAAKDLAIIQLNTLTEVQTWMGDHL